MVYLKAISVFPLMKSLPRRVFFSTHAKTHSIQSRLATRNKLVLQYYKDAKTIRLVILTSKMD